MIVSCSIPFGGIREKFAGYEKAKWLGESDNAIGADAAHEVVRAQLAWMLEPDRTDELGQCYLTVSSAASSRPSMAFPSSDRHAGAEFCLGPAPVVRQLVSRCLGNGASGRQLSRCPPSFLGAVAESQTSSLTCIRNKTCVV